MLSFFLFVCKLLPQISSSMHCCLCIIDVRSPMRWHSFLWYSASLFFTLKSFHLRIEQPAVVRAWRNVIDYGCLFWPLSSRAAIHFKRRLGFFGGSVLFKKTKKPLTCIQTHTQTHQENIISGIAALSHLLSLWPLTLHHTEGWYIHLCHIHSPKEELPLHLSFLCFLFLPFSQGSWLVCLLFFLNQAVLNGMNGSKKFCPGLLQSVSPQHWSRSLFSVPLWVAPDTHSNIWSLPPPPGTHINHCWQCALKIQCVG